MRRFNRVVFCTGPNNNILEWENPLIQQLFRDRYVAPDHHMLGIRATDDGRTIAAINTIPNDFLYVMGALRRGELWESTAVPELRDQAAIIATALTRAA